MIRKTLPVLKSAVKGMANLDTVLSKCFVIADLGCSNGPNTLLAASIIIDVVLERCREDNHHKAPQFQVFLNDLYGNDFNAIFQSLPNFYANFKKEKGENFSCFVSATPGSFYGRLFQDGSLHLVHSG